MIKKILLALMLLTSFLIITPTVQANDEFCEDTQTIKVSGLVNIADVEICQSHQDQYGELGDVGSFSLRVSIPNIATTPTISVTAGTPIGCTLGTPIVRGVSGTSGASASYFNTYLATDTTCVISLWVQITIAAVTVFDQDFDYGAYCICSTQRIAQSGAWTITDDANGWALTGTLNVVNSGGQTLSISSWPQLLATLSGGVTITDDANGWTIHQDPLSGTINVVNSGGQSIAITSWPDLLNTTTNAVVNIGNFTNFEANETAALQEQAEVNKGGILLFIFVVAILIAEWKKDAIWHLIAVLIGALTMTSTVDNLGVPRIIILAIVIYQFVRLYKVASTNRNQLGSEKDN